MDWQLPASVLIRRVKYAILQTKPSSLFAVTRALQRQSAVPSCTKTWRPLQIQKGAAFCEKVLIVSCLKPALNSKARWQCFELTCRPQL